VERIGILGGSFDPLHLGHLWMAERARDQLSLDRVLLMPAARPPHKDSDDMSPFSDRMTMVTRAIAGIPGLEVSDLEANRAEPSYTWDTLDRLRREYPKASFWLVLGGDSLRDLPTWRHPERIMSHARLAVLPRPGDAEFPAVPAGAQVDWLDGPRIQLSSTEIRTRVRQGRSIRFLVPDSTREYLEAASLYQDVPA